MALRVLRSVNEHCAQVVRVTGSRLFNRSRSLEDDVDDVSRAVKGPGGGGSVSGNKDMNVGDRESVTEGAEGPKDVADSMKKHDNAGKTDSTGDLSGKPVGNAATQDVREDIAGSTP